MLKSLDHIRDMSLAFKSDSIELKEIRATLYVNFVCRRLYGVQIPKEEADVQRTADLIDRVLRAMRRAQEIMKPVPMTSWEQVRNWIRHHGGVGEFFLVLGLGMRSSKKISEYEDDPGAVIQVYHEIDDTRREYDDWAALEAAEDHIAEGLRKSAFYAYNWDEQVA